MPEVTHWVLSDCVQKIARVKMPEVSCAPALSYVTCQTCMDQVKALRSGALGISKEHVSAGFLQDQLAQERRENLRLRKELARKSTVPHEVDILQDMLRRRAIGQLAWYRYTPPRDRYGSHRLEVRRDKIVTETRWLHGYTVALNQVGKEVFEGGERQTYKVDEAARWIQSLLETGKFPAHSIG